uniref:Glycoside hydrolase 35 catalytic domain-containing protein n=1 Tax=Acrobeloides nanus TaxID=290746 RepID=A0A914EGK1_9BILA
MGSYFVTSPERSIIFAFILNSDLIGYKGSQRPDSMLCKWSIHYFRIHPDLWNDRLQRVRALGFNAVQVYVAWNMHEPIEGT